MAQSTATSSEAPDLLPDAVTSTADDAKNDAQLTAQLNKFLHGYSPNNNNATPDVLEERYRIEFSEPLPGFNTKNAKAYAATDLTEPSKSLFAHICEPASLQRHRVINALKNVSHPHIMSLVAAGATKLSRTDDEHFVIFYERPQGKTLSELLSQNHNRVTPNFICDRIIAPLASAINQFAELDIAHGSINPDNIYLRDTAVLGPCVSEPCGYSQPFYYEPLERMQAMPAGKGEGSTAQDYYALAAVVLYALYGASHFADMTADSLARSILKEGVYNALTRQKEMPEIFYDFFRGMLSQYSEDRWDYQYLRPWLEGKRYNVLPPPPPLEAIRPFDFNEAQANTRRELAYLFYADWEKIVEPVRNGKLTRWLSISLRHKDLAEKFTRISRTVIELGLKSDVQLSEQLMHVLLLLDPHGPIRIKHLSMFIDGIDSLCAELYITKTHQELQLLAKFIELNMVNYWLEIQRKVQDFVIPTSINTMLARIERLRPMMRYAGLGFGLERMLYELNPDLPCLSPLLKKWHIQTLEALLLKLDELAPTLTKDDELLDRHMAAFIASKLNIQHEIRLHELSAIPGLAANRSIIALHLLSLAQQKARDIQLRGVTHFLALRIFPALDIIHSRTLKNKVKGMLVEEAGSGYLQYLSDIIVTSNYASADQLSFEQARNLYLTNESKIAGYRQGSNIDKEGANLGFMLAKTLAYIALGLSIFNIFWGM